MEWTDIRRTRDFAEKKNLKRKTKWFSEKQKKKTNQLNLSVEQLHCTDRSRKCWTGRPSKRKTKLKKWKSLFAERQSCKKTKE